MQTYWIITCNCFNIFIFCFHILLFSIGHSNQSFDQFVSLLLQHKIEVIIDVRIHPQSRFSPQFNKSALEDSLQAYWIKYHHCIRLWGGHQYTKLYKLNFDREISYVIEEQKTQRVCLMCSEWDPRITKSRRYECHRLSLLSPVFLLQGIEVFHILPSWEIFETKDYQNKSLF